MQTTGYWSSPQAWRLVRKAVLSAGLLCLSQREGKTVLFTAAWKSCKTLPVSTQSKELHPCICLLPYAKGHWSRWEVYHRLSRTKDWLHVCPFFRCQGNYLVMTTFVNILSLQFNKYLPLNKKNVLLLYTRLPPSHFAPSDISLCMKELLTLQVIHLFKFCCLWVDHILSKQHENGTWWRKWHFEKKLWSLIHIQDFSSLLLNRVGWF